MLIKISIPKTTIFLSIFLACAFLNDSLFASEVAQETIIYDISPMGQSEYQDFGLVDYGGRKMNLVVFKTQVVGFNDTEKIYSAPGDYLPLRVERDISMWLHREYLTEEYFPLENRMSITKFEGGRKTQEYFYKADRPINNAILVPFSLRRIPDLKIGWTYDIRLPAEFKVKLAGIEEVAVPAGKFKAYHFTSTPPKFEIWISNDRLRIPVKIKGLGAFSYTMAMKEYILKKGKVS